jgi:hypothetical protein
MSRRPGLRISPDLGLSIGNETVTVSPAAGLRLAEELARKSFRRALAEEACLPGDTPRKRRPSPSAGGPLRSVVR